MTRSIRVLWALAVAILMAMGVAACGDDESAGPEEGETVEDVREDEDPGVVDDTDALFDNEDELLGEEVTVSAEVAAVHTPAILSIAGEGGDDAILVVAQNPDMVPAEVSDNAVVQVTGTVRELIEIEVFDDFTTEFEDDGPFEFGVEDEEFIGGTELDEFEGDHFVVASEINVLEATEDG